MLPSIRMEIFFEDPDHPPLPPDQVRIIDLKAEPLIDGRRVRIYLELTPFLNKPDGEISIFDSLGEEVAHASLVEMMLPKIVLTLHLRGGKTCGVFTVFVQIFYSQNPFDAKMNETITNEVVMPALVDQKEIAFTLDETTVNRKE